jgi:hypothetical protein
MSRPGSHNEANRWIRTQPGGDELLDAIEIVNSMYRGLKLRASNGDRMAGEKISVAEVALDQLIEIRDSMHKHYMEHVRPTIHKTGD